MRKDACKVCVHVCMCVVAGCNLNPGVSVAAAYVPVWGSGNVAGQKPTSTNNGPYVVSALRLEQEGDCVQMVRGTWSKGRRGCGSPVCVVSVAHFCVEDEDTWGTYMRQGSFIWEQTYFGDLVHAGASLSSVQSWNGRRYFSISNTDNATFTVENVCVCL